MDKKRAEDVMYLDFSKTLCIVSQSSLIYKLRNHGLEMQTVTWV